MQILKLYVNYKQVNNNESAVQGLCLYFSFSDRGVDTRFRANHITNMLAICKLGHFRAMKSLITKWSSMQVNLYQGLARFNKVSQLRSCLANKM